MTARPSPGRARAPRGPSLETGAVVLEDAHRSRVGVLAPCLLLLAASLLTLHGATASATDYVKFFVPPEKANQSTARAMCRNYGYDDLATLNSSEKQRLAELVLQAYNYSVPLQDVWIGAESPDLNANYFWPGMQPLSWTFWDNVTADEPNGQGIEGCVRIKVKAGFRWGTMRCLREYYGLCEKRGTFTKRSGEMAVLARDVGVTGLAYWTGQVRSKGSCFMQCLALGYSCLLTYHHGTTCTLYSTYDVTLTPGTHPGSVLVRTLPEGFTWT